MKKKSWIQELGKHLSKDQIVGSNPGDEWFCVNDLMKEIGKGYGACSRQIKEMQEKNLLESRLFRVRGLNRSRPLMHYRFKK